MNQQPHWSVSTPGCGVKALTDRNVDGNYQVDVVLVGDETDPHITLVRDRLEASGSRTLRWNLGDLRSSEHVAELGQLAVLVDGTWALVTPPTTVWWHRSGAVDVSGLDPEEARLVAEESPIMLRGALLAAGVRWIDDPYVIDRAESRFAQLAAARAVGLAIPGTRQTNSMAAAEALRDLGAVVAKPVSPGQGIVPFTDILTDEEFDLLEGNPTFLQQLVTAKADLRVVTVGGASWVWRRSRPAGIVDWRAVDPAGAGFEFIKKAKKLAGQATEVTARLRLTMGVSDWLETDEGYVFLEVNPQGQWLFLRRADELVVPAVVALLQVPVAAPGLPADGRWPKAWRRVLWDLGPASWAEPDDGIVAPSPTRPDWVDRVAALPGAVEVAQTANHAAQDAAATAEAKASRLVQLGLALLALAFAVGAYQLTFDLKRSAWYLFSLVPVGSALLFLAVATFEAGEIDRVGVYRSTEPKDLDGVGPAAATTVELEIEERGRHLARWTARNKHTDLMWARAWLVRGLVALIVAALVAGICRGASTAVPTSPTTSTTVHSPTKTGGGSPSNTGARKVHGA